MPNCDRGGTLLDVRDGITVERKVKCILKILHLSWVAVGSVLDTIFCES